MELERNGQGYWRERADEMREVADKMRNPETRVAMWKLAASCLRHADRWGNKFATKRKDAAGSDRR